MALLEAAPFATLHEAEVACSALRAGGVDATVFDRNMASNFWIDQVAIGGVRLAVRDGDLPAAADFLHAVRRSDPAALRWTDHPQRFSGIPLAFLALVLTDGGWALALLRARFTITRLAVVVLYASAIGWLMLAPWFMRTD